MRILKYILFLAILIPYNSATSSYADKTLNGLYKAKAKQHNVSFEVLRAICEVETGHNVKLKRTWDGGSYSYGICQVKLATARAMGFKGTEKQLSSPDTNIEYAAKYLAYQLKRYNGNYEKAIVSYNRGSYSNEGKRSYSGKVALSFLLFKLKGR